MTRPDKTLVQTQDELAQEIVKTLGFRFVPPISPLLPESSVAVPESLAPTITQHQFEAVKKLLALYCVEVLDLK